MSFYLILLSYAFSYATITFGSITQTDFIAFASLQDEFIVVVLVAPLVETMLFQSFLVDLTFPLSKRLIFRYSTYIAIILPAMLFGLAHLYSTLYMIYTFLGGLTFGIGS